MALFHDFRVKISSNLPPGNLPDYQKWRTGTPTTAQLAKYTSDFDTAVSKYQYDQYDIALNQADQDLAKKTPSITAVAGKTLSDDYTAEIAADGAKVDAGETADKGTPHDDAKIVPLRKNILYFHTADKFRKLLHPAAPVNPTPVAADKGLYLPDGLQPFVKNDATWATYVKQRETDRAVINNPKSDPADVTAAKADLAKANEGILALVRARQGDHSLDVAGLKSLLSGDFAPAWKQLCDPYNRNGPSSPMSGPTSQDCIPPSAYPAEYAKCKTPVTSTPGDKGAPPTQTGGLNPTCVAAIKTQCTGTTTGAPQTSSFTTDQNSALGIACLNAPTNTVTPSNDQTTATVNTSNGVVPDPAGKPATQGDTSPAKPDANLMTHVRNGVGGALVGIIFGVFFGPVGVIAGAALGFGIGYLGDRFFGSGYAPGS